MSDDSFLDGVEGISEDRLRKIIVKGFNPVALDAKAACLQEFRRAMAPLSTIAM